MAFLIGGCLNRDWSLCSPLGEEHSRQSEQEGSKVGLRGMVEEQPGGQGVAGMCGQWRKW